MTECLRFLSLPAVDLVNVVSIQLINDFIRQQSLNSFVRELMEQYSNRISLDR